MSLFKGPTPNAPNAAAAPTWKVLIVDDEPMVHTVTRMALDDLHYEGRRLEFHFADSARHARGVLAAVPDFAVALIDVVMESDRAGLDLVGHIRSELKDSCVRLILRTGQPGMTPERTALAEFDINTYLDKSSTDANRLYAAVLTALRSFDEVSRLRDSIRQLEALSVTDPLTRLSNAGTLRPALARALGGAKRRGETLSVVFLDVDDFKRINDDHGHLAGDEVLRSVGAAILANSRLEDGCFRYGGDEFFVVLPNCGEAQVHEHYLPRLLQAFDRLGVRVSHGVMQTGPHVYHDAEDLIRLADERMYVQKREAKARQAGAAASAPPGRDDDGDDAGAATTLNAA